MVQLTVDEAVEAILNKTQRLNSETVGIDHAHSRVLAKPLTAKLTQPPFNASAMDGYALHYSDIATIPARLRLVGESAAGSRYTGTIKQGEAVRIFTGAPVPDDADTVVIQEKTNRIDDQYVEIIEESGINQNIRPLGGDFKRGQTLLGEGHFLTPSAIALIAASGHDTVTVIRRPRIAILATGDELVPAGGTPGPDQIIASNSYGLTDIAQFYGAEVINLGIANDNKEAIKSAVLKAQESKADLLLTSGGVSVGDYDLVQVVLKECGMTLDFWKIAMRPGKPLMFGELSGSHPLLVMGLPGNPISSLVCAQLFLVPLLNKMAGRRYRQNIISARLTKALPANGPRRHYIRTVLERDENGVFLATPQSSQDSSLLSLMAVANGLIVHEKEAASLKAGDSCRVFIPETGL